MTARCNCSRNNSLKRLQAAALAIAALLAASSAGAALPWVRPAGAAGDFGLVHGSTAAPVVYAESDSSVVAIAARDLAADIARVTGRTPAVQTGAAAPTGAAGMQAGAAAAQAAAAGARADAAGAQAEVVLVGTLGHSPAIDALAASGKLDLSGLRGAWESFIIATVEAPSPGIGRALVIAGSDPRGTAFGIYELSQAIGVSPWYWWADVVPEHKDALFVAAGTRRFGPPSVKYRGIFINDEDWGLQPWAANTFEPEHGGIGPKRRCWTCTARA